MPSRALADSSPISFAICSTPFWSAFLMTGTTRPFGVSAAKPTWKYFLRTRLSPSTLVTSEALKSGNFFSAATDALIRNASIVILMPAFSFSLLSWTRKASRSVMSASSNCVTCGIITQLRARLAPEIFLMRDSGFASIGPNLAKSTAGHGSRLSEPPPLMPPAAARRAAAAAHGRLDEILHVLLQDARAGTRALDLRQVDAQFARELAHGRRRMRALERFVVDGRGGHCRRGRRCGERCRCGRRRRRRRAAGAGGGADGRGRRCRRGGLGFACGRGVEREDQRPFADLVAQLQLQVPDHACRGRRHVHRRLVRFQRDQRVLGLHRVARLHEDLDDRNVLEVADVGDLDFDRAHFCLVIRSFHMQAF